MANGVAKRRYTDEDRANAVAAVAANRGNVIATAKQLGIPRKTLEHWVKGSAHPEAAKNGQAKRGPMADALEAVAWKLLDEIPGKIEKATLSQTATAMGIAIDKARLLRGEPTSIDEQRGINQLVILRERYTELYAVAGPGTDAGPQPLPVPLADGEAAPVPGT